MDQLAQLAKQQPKAFRRPIADVEQWIIHGGVKSDASELGRGLQDLDSLDENGKILSICLSNCLDISDALLISLRLVPKLAL